VALQKLAGVAGRALPVCILQYLALSYVALH